MRCADCPFRLGCPPPLRGDGTPMREEQARCWLDAIPGARRPDGQRVGA